MDPSEQFVGYHSETNDKEKTMGAHLGIFAALLAAQFAYASEPLHTFSSSKLKIYATDSVERVDVSDRNIRFHLVDKKIFATAFLFQDTQNSYPQLTEFSEQFLKMAYSGDEYRVLSKLNVESKFSNVTADGREVLIDSENGPCELVLVTTVGDRTYIHFQVVDPSSDPSCEISGAGLRAIVDKVTASIAVTES